MNGSPTKTPPEFIAAHKTHHRQRVKDPGWLGVACRSFCLKLANKLPSGGERGSEKGWACDFLRLGS